MIDIILCILLALAIATAIWYRGKTEDEKHKSWSVKHNADFKVFTIVLELQKNEREVEVIKTEHKAHIDILNAHIEDWQKECDKLKEENRILKNENKGLQLTLNVLSCAKVTKQEGDK